MRTIEEKRAYFRQKTREYRERIKGTEKERLQRERQRERQRILIKTPEDKAYKKKYYEKNRERILAFQRWRTIEKHLKKLAEKRIELWHPI